MRLDWLQKEQKPVTEATGSQGDGRGYGSWSEGGPRETARGVLFQRRFLIATAVPKARRFEQEKRKYLHGNWLRQTALHRARQRSGRIVQVLPMICVIASLQAQQRSRCWVNGRHRSVCCLNLP